jgi:hypothetical protein
MRSTKRLLRGELNQIVVERIEFLPGTGAIWALSLVGQADKLRRYQAGG